MDIKGKFRQLAANKTARRILSIVLAVALAATTITVALVQSSAAPSNFMTTTPAPTITFTAPEAAWLAMPGATTGTSSTISSYASIGGGTGLSPTGQLEFSVSGATVTSCTITNDIIPGSWSNTNTTLANGLTVPAQTHNTRELSEWRAEFYLQGSTQKYTAYAYTVIWCPSLLATATFIYTSTFPLGAVNRYYAGSVFGMLGFHSVSTGSFDTSNSDDSANYRPNNTFRTDWINRTYNGNDDTKPQDIYASTTDTINTVGSAMYNNYEPTAGEGNTWASNTSGVLTVDTSRFGNVNLVPGMRIALVITSNRNINNQEGGWSVSVGSSSGSANNATNSVKEDMKWSANGPDVGLTGTSAQVVTGTATYNNHWGLGTNGTSSQKSTHYFGFTVNKVDKDTNLRPAVRNAYTGRYANEWIDNLGGGSGFENTLKEKAQWLGDPKDGNYGTPGYNYAAPRSDIAAQERNLNTAEVNILLQGSGQPLLDFDPSAVIPDDEDTIDYYKGDSISVLAPIIPGYELVSVDTNTTRGAAPTNKAYSQDYKYATIPDVYWDFYYRPIVTYTVNYAYEGGTGTGMPASQSGTSQEPSTVVYMPNSTAATFTKDGYTFAGWKFTTASGATTVAGGLPLWQFLDNYSGVFAGTDYVAATNTVTLHAVWDREGDRRVEYYPNAVDAFPAGSPAYSEGPYTPGMTDTANTHTIKDYSSFTRPGWTLAGWNTQADGLGTAYTSGAPFTFPAGATANLKLYAVWQTATITVNFTDGEPFNTKSYNLGEIYGTLPTVPQTAKPGYQFMGWNELAGESAASITSATVVGNTAGTVTLYAAWSPWKFTVQYDLNGGSGTQPASLSVPFDSSITLAGLSGFSRSGYDFKGWALTSGATVALGLTYPYPGTTTATVATLRSNTSPYPTGNNLPGEAITLYAVWEAKPLEVTYNVNWPTAALVDAPTPVVPGSGKIKVKYGSTYGLDENGATRAMEWAGGASFGGWVFMGWYQDDAGTVPATASSPVTKITDHEIFAKWAPPGSVIETVNFLPMIGGSLPGYGQDAAVPVTVLNGDLILFRPDWIPQRNGYTFDGWAFKVPGDAGTRAILDATAKVSLKIDNGTADHSIIEMEAQWVPTNYEVIYHADNPAAVALGLADGAFASVPAGFTGSGASTSISGIKADPYPASAGTKNVPAPTGADAPVCYGYNFRGFAAEVNGALVTSPLVVPGTAAGATLAALIGATVNYKTNDDEDPVKLHLYAVWEPKGGNPGGDPYDPDDPNPLDPPAPPDGPADIDPDDPNNADDGIISLYFVTGEMDSGFFKEYVADAAGISMYPAMRARLCQFAGAYGWAGQLPMAYTATQYTSGWEIAAIGSADSAALFHPDTASADTLDGLGIGDKLEPGTRVLSEKSVWVKPIWENDWVVKYDANAGTVGGAAAATKYAFPGQTYGASGMVDAIRTDYDFLGWFTAAAGGVRVLPGDAVTADITLYAQWTYSRSWWDDVTGWFNDRYGTTGRNTPGWVFTKDLPCCLKTGLGISLPILGALGFRIAKISTWSRFCIGFWGFIGLLFSPLALTFSCVWPVIRAIIPNWWPSWRWLSVSVGVWWF